MVCWAAVCDKRSPTVSLLNWRTNKRLFSILYAIFFPDAIRWVGLTNEEVLELFLFYHTMKWPWILLDLVQQPCPVKPFCPAKINRSLLTLIVLLLNTNSPFILCALIVSSAHPRDAIIRLIHNIALSIPSDPSHDNRQQNSGEKKIIATTSFEECEWRKNSTHRHQFIYRFGRSAASGVFFVASTQSQYPTRARPTITHRTQLIYTPWRMAIGHTSRHPYASVDSLRHSPRHTRTLDIHNPCQNRWGWSVAVVAGRPTATNAIL